LFELRINSGALVPLAQLIGTHRKIALPVILSAYLVFSRCRGCFTSSRVSTFLFIVRHFWLTLPLCKWRWWVWLLYRVLFTPSVVHRRILAVLLRRLCTLWSLFLFGIAVAPWFVIDHFARMRDFVYASLFGVAIILLYCHYIITSDGRVGEAFGNPIWVVVGPILSFGSDAVSRGSSCSVVWCVGDFSKWHQFVSVSVTII